MTDQLSLYNGALRHLKERKLATLTDDRPARYVLDDIWNDGFRDTILEAGLWLFAKRSTKIEYDASITTNFGYTRAANLPDDWVRTIAVSADEYFNNPLLQMTQEAGNIYSDVDTIYLQYVSDDTGYGYDLSLWPQSVKLYAEAYLAEIACKPITKSDELYKDLQKEVLRLLKDARSKDASNLPTQFMPRGSWVSARRGRFMRNDRPGSKLIG